MLDKHYKQFEIEPEIIDFKHGLSYLCGSFLRYIARYNTIERDKANIEDLQKCLQWCLPRTYNYLDSEVLIQYPHGIGKSISYFCNANNLNDFQKRVLRNYFLGLEYYASLGELKAIELIYEAENDIKKEIKKQSCQ